MKYQQPYGVSDPNAPYVNGNPSTGTMGSIPPAASIEHPMRELVNMITHSGGVPNDADLHQLAKAVQSGKVVYGIDAGTANQLSVTLQPPLVEYPEGLRLCVKVLNANTGASTINVNGLGAQPINYPNGTPLKGNELAIGAIASMIYDGVEFQLQNVASNVLAAPLNYYVNDAVGDDNLFDGTSAMPSGGIHGPFRTHNRAISAAQSWNQNGYSVDIRTADGTYPPIRPAGGPNGTGGINLWGNMANPAACLIHATVDEAIFFGANGFAIRGFKVQADSVSAAPYIAAGLRLISCVVWMENCEFGACLDYHMFVDASSRLSVGGLDINMPATFVKVSGDCTRAHIMGATNSMVHFAGTQLVTVGVRSVGVWVLAANAAVCAVRYSSQTLGGAVHGQRYIAAGNGVVAGSGAVPNYYPGDVAGATSTGGQVT